MYTLVQVIDLVNYFVTYGDLIMPDPASLYALYYEIVRSGIDVFSELAKECTCILDSIDRGGQGNTSLSY